jgi:regulatory protein
MHEAATPARTMWQDRGMERDGRNRADPEGEASDGGGGATVPAALDAAALERAAIDYLARYAASRQGVARVLERRIARAARRGAIDADAARATARAVIDGLVARGLLDDGRFAEGRARSLLGRGRSTAAIRAALRDKGVDAASADHALATLADETPDPDLAAAIALARRRRLGPFAAPATRRARRDKDLGVMARAGFPRAVACRVIDAADVAALEALARGTDR